MEQISREKNLERIDACIAEAEKERDAARIEFDGWDIHTEFLKRARLIIIEKMDEAGLP